MIEPIYETEGYDMPPLHEYPGQYTVENKRITWAVITQDRGPVWRTEVVDVIKKGGYLLPSGKNGMVTTRPQKVIITSEYATVLLLKEELHTLFTRR